MTTEEVEGQFRAAAELHPRLTHLDLEPRGDRAPMTSDDFIAKIEMWLPRDWCFQLVAQPVDGRLYFGASAWLDGDVSINVHSMGLRRRPDEALEDVFLQLRDL